MLDHLGFEDAGTQLRAALERVYEEAKVLTPDQGGTASTTEFCSAVESEV
jgi:isocitrate/isopropylmalate dehydrogenase